MKDHKTVDNPSGLEIAVIGMAGRFPGARTIQQFWQNLIKGVESVSFLTEEEIAELENGPEMMANPGYVNSKGGVLEGKEQFDASFFGYTPIEALIMNPQTRIFHECAWEALEDAGYNSNQYKGLIGLYAGASHDFSWGAEAESYYLLEKPMIDRFTYSLFIKKDFLGTLVSYKLNLKGPGYMVYSACSTSLVAVNLACRGLLTAECEIALAGGVSINTEKKEGYIYNEGMITSSDGHCRAFDQEADGTVIGEGVGIVVLKRLIDACQDRDHIYAIIKGYAANNDGTSKVGYTAPSPKGQAAVIKEALHMAEVSPESMCYIEAHGTGTTLGDPIEIEALKKSFILGKGDKIAIGSLKTNVGHLDTASGIAGLIKTVLVLKNRIIPPSLNYKKSNPEMDLENSPFYVNTRLKEWKNDDQPMRAGISAFGIGGTNAHIILEEAPLSRNNRNEESMMASTALYLLQLSAKTSTALEQITEDLEEHLIKNPKIPLADVAYTLRQGREHFQYRRILVCQDVKSAIEAFRNPETGQINTYHQGHQHSRVVFMFPGQGSQYVQMGLELYQEESEFRNQMDECLRILKRFTKININDILYPDGKSRNEVFTIQDTEVTQPLLFSFEYALAIQLIKQGIKPSALIGHSIGEYTAATISGVLTLEEALEIVTLRGQIMQKTQKGNMLSIRLSEEKLRVLLREYETPDLSLAAVNAPGICVISGTRDSINSFSGLLEKRGVENQLLHTSHAYHSALMTPILEEFRKQVNRILSKKDFRESKIPYISNVTGTWITPKDNMNPEYWVHHLAKTVRFSDGVLEILKEKDNIFVEVGPGNSLGTLVRQHLGKNKELKALSLIPHARETLSETQYYLQKLGILWLYGQEIDWSIQETKEKPMRVSLPTYPFEGNDYWLEGYLDKIGTGVLSGYALHKKNKQSQWLYVPSWKMQPLSVINLDTTTLKGINVLLMGTEIEWSELLKKRLQQLGARVTVVEMGDFYKKDKQGNYTIRISENTDYISLFKELREDYNEPNWILHTWNLCDQADQDFKIDDIPTELEKGYYSLLRLAQAAGETDITNDIRMMVISGHLFELTGEETLSPEKSLLLGPVMVIPIEYRNISCRYLDIDVAKKRKKEKQGIVELIIREALTKTGEMCVAFRGKHRWVRTMESYTMEKVPESEINIKRGGVYLITGGLGGIGITIACGLAEVAPVKLVLLARKPFPAEEEWQQWLEHHREEDKTSQKIRELLEIKKIGSEIMILPVDVAHLEQMKEAISKVKAGFGPISGVIHSAGIADGALIQVREDKQSEKVLAPKVKGTWVMEEVLKGEPLDFFILCSSINAIIPAVGHAAYCSANAFQDAFSHFKHQGEQHDTLSINWDRWLEKGMAHDALKQQASIEKNTSPARIDSIGITPTEGKKVFQQVLALSQPQVAISTRDLGSILQQYQQSEHPAMDDPDMKEIPKSTGPKNQRPGLTTDYIPPRDSLEQQLVNLWQDFFGIQKIGIQDDFFELGGHSLKGTILISMIQRDLNTQIPLKQLLKTPTVQGLSQYIRQADPTGFTFIPHTEEKEYYPLSSAQKRLYILQQMDQHSVGYNIPIYREIIGEIDKDKLEQAFIRLIQRYDSLRTSFEMVKGNPIQRINSPPEIRICYLEEKPGKNEMGELLKGLVKPFDLREAPLFRVCLVRTRGGNHQLWVDMHHIITDGTSIQVLLKEFMVLYKGKELGRVKYHYKDYTMWLKSPEKEKHLHHQGQYWARLYQEEIPVLNLPADFPRPMVQTYEGDSEDFDITVDETNALKEIAAAHGATLYMVVLSVYGMMLSHFCQQDDLVIGTPIAGRQHADLEKIVGVCINTLCLRVQPAGNKTFTHYLEELREHTLKGFENQDYPYEELVEQLNVPRDMSRNPLFNTLLAFQQFDIGNRDIPDNEAEIRDLKLHTIKQKSTVSKFDLSLYYEEIQEALYFTFEYSAALFKRETIHRFTLGFKRVIKEIITDTSREISKIEILSPEEKRQLLKEFNRTETDYPKDKTPGQIIREQSESTSHRIALVGHYGRIEENKGETNDNSGIHQLTFNQMNKRAEQTAEHLENKGVLPREIVGVLYGRTLDMMISILSLIKVGAAYLPLDPGYPRNRITYMLRDCAATKILTDAMNADLPEGPETIRMNDQNTRAGSRIKKHKGTTPLDPMYVIYTSGSIGQPKGVVIENRSFVNFITGIGQQMNRIDHKEESHIYLSLTTVSFDIWGLETLLPLTQGDRVVLGGEEEQLVVSAAAKALIREKVTHFQLTPSRLELFLSEKTASQSLGQLKNVLVGGETFPSDLLRQVKGITRGRVYNLYGPTETTIWSTIRECKMDDTIDIGKPISNTKIYILGSGKTALPIGVQGELYISGHGLARGYVNKPPLMQEAFIPSPFEQGEYLYRTGDLARWKSDGNIEHLGRIDHQVKIRGFRIELGEIEALLKEKPGIREAVVVDLRGSRGEKYLCAYIVSDIEYPFQELRLHLATQVPGYMIPISYNYIKQIPLTPNGKVNRKALPEPGFETGAAYKEPETEMEKKVLKVWKEILGKEKIGVQDNFFHLGGNSLNILQLSHRLREEIKREIPVVILFKYLTIRDFVKYLCLETGETAKSDSRDNESLEELERAKRKYQKSMGKMRILKNARQQS
jgi:iturin family lipopeptide synthetase A